MGYSHQRKVSLLEGEEFFFNKVLSRDSSVGCSSRILYYRSNAEGVPFKWEMQPGKPKEPPKEDIIPPLSPPPAVLSLGLPKPAIEEPPSNDKASILKSIKRMFWKRNKKGRGVLFNKNKNKNVIQNQNGYNKNKESIDHVNDYGSSEEFVEYYSSDDIGKEFMASSRNSSSSSSNYSSFSFCNNNNNNNNNAHHHSSQSSSRVQSPGREQIDGVFYGGCSPWHITSVIVRVARRNI